MESTNKFVKMNDVHDSMATKLIELNTIFFFDHAERTLAQ